MLHSSLRGSLRDFHLQLIIFDFFKPTHTSSYFSHGRPANIPWFKCPSLLRPLPGSGALSGSGLPSNARNFVQASHDIGASPFMCRGPLWTKQSPSSEPHPQAGGQSDMSTENKEITQHGRGYKCFGKIGPSEGIGGAGSRQGRCCFREDELY